MPHTGADWHFEEESGFIGDAGCHVATITPAVKMRGCWPEGIEAERKANGLLIAAAPNLLAACEVMLRRMDAWARSGNPPQSRDKLAMSAARAALRKATGKKRYVLE